jgi:hypothetical protein
MLAEEQFMKRALIEKIQNNVAELAPLTPSAWAWGSKRERAARTTIVGFAPASVIGELPLKNDAPKSSNRHMGEESSSLKGIAVAWVRYPAGLTGSF